MHALWGRHGPHANLRPRLETEGLDQGRNAEVPEGLTRAEALSTILQPKNEVPELCWLPSTAEVQWEPKMRTTDNPMAPQSGWESKAGRRQLCDLRRGGPERNH